MPAAILAPVLVKYAKPKVSSIAHSGALNPQSTGLPFAPMPVIFTAIRYQTPLVCTKLFIPGVNAVFKAGTVRALNTTDDLGTVRSVPTRGPAGPLPTGAATGPVKNSAFSVTVRGHTKCK